MCAESTFGVILTLTILTRASLKGNHTRSLMLLLSIPPQPCGMWALFWESKASIGQSETAPMSMVVSQVSQ